MQSNLREKIDDVKERAIEIALIPVGFVIDPIGRYLMKRMHIHQEIAKDILVSSDWTIITPQNSMKIKKRFQEVSLILENCKQNFDKNPTTLIFSDGTVINPAKQIVVEIFDEDGNKYKLKSGSYGVSNFDEKAGTCIVSSAGFRSYKVALPRDKTFKEVRIRSDKSFYCKRIIWHDFDMK